MKASLEQELQSFLNEKIELTLPPKPEMGDFCIPCFEMAKREKKNPLEIAESLKSKVISLKSPLIDRVESMGPYVNIFLNKEAATKEVLHAIQKSGESYGSHETGKGKKIMIEFAHPNTHKQFHIGHLRNIITGESLVRIHENAGFEVIRANYQGDIGMHIAKSLWGIHELMDEYDKVKHADLHVEVAFLGKAYAHGAKAFEESEPFGSFGSTQDKLAQGKAKAEIEDMNRKIYVHDPSILAVYQTTRAWSLEYFDFIYQRLGTHFDRLYFESQVHERGIELVRHGVKNCVFKESEGAVIFEGSKYGLHDRVFINSKGFPTYEGKEVALAELQMSEYHPDRIIHVTAKEQVDYFKVVFAAIGAMFPEFKGKEQHVPYGWVKLKEGKMSSRTGNVVLGEWLLDEVKKEIVSTMADRDFAKKEETVDAIALAAVKYAFLRTGVDKDIAFDINESISVTGDSGPYLLYIVTRINSILKKAGKREEGTVTVPSQLHESEWALIMALSQFGDATESALEGYNPSLIAHYLFGLAQAFNMFYEHCPVLQAEDKAVVAFRLTLIEAVAGVMTKGLYLLGVETVEEM